MIRRPPISTRTDTLFPYTTLFRSALVPRTFGNPELGPEIGKEFEVGFDTEFFGQRVDLSFTTRSEEHTSELQSLMRISYAVFCLKKKRIKTVTSTIAIISTLNYLISTLHITPDTSYEQTHTP